MDVTDSVTDNVTDLVSEQATDAMEVIEPVKDTATGERKGDSLNDCEAHVDNADDEDDDDVDQFHGTNVS